MPLLFDTLGVKRYPITKKSEKAKWNQFLGSLQDSRKKATIDILRDVLNSKLIPIPPQIELLYKQMIDFPNDPYRNTTLELLAETKYSEFINAISFLRPTADFSTEHGVKGEEYDNVIFVIGRGWNNYQFDKYIPMLNSSVPNEQAAFERNRNLFYVCCSRPKKRLILFVTIPVEGYFKSYLENLVGTENFYNYKDFKSKFST